MELRCYEDGRPLSPDEEAVLAVRSRADASSSGGPDALPAGQEFALFHIDCYPAESEDWVRVRQARAGLLHETPP